MKGKCSLFAKVNYQPISGDISYMGSGDYSTFSRYISKRSDIDVNDTLDIIAHGSNDRIYFSIDNKIYNLSAREAAKIIRRNEQYNKYKFVRLFSCNTGSNPNGFAQNLANALGKIVYAPNNYIWSWSNGSYGVYGMKNNKPDLSNPGVFIKFIPGGNRK